MRNKSVEIVTLNGSLFWLPIRIKNALLHQLAAKLYFYLKLSLSKLTKSVKIKFVSNPTEIEEAR